MILPTSSGTLRTSYLRVLSDLSGRMEPHPKCSFILTSACARSAFWLTEKLGRRSQPNLWRLLLLNVMQKQPSPSTNPDKYDSQLTISPFRIPGVLPSLILPES